MSNTYYQVFHKLHMLWMCIWWCVLILLLKLSATVKSSLEFSYPPPKGKNRTLWDHIRCFAAKSSFCCRCAYVAVFMATPLQLQTKLMNLLWNSHYLPRAEGQTTEAQDHSCGLLILLHQFQTHIRCFTTFIFLITSWGANQGLVCIRWCSRPVQVGSTSMSNKPKVHHNPHML